MTLNASCRTGAAFAVTVVFGYSLCTLVFWALPESSVNFMNALFHGLDFRKLQAGTELFTFGSFVYAAAVLGGWAFMLGALFAWLAACTGARREA